jgi:NADH:ubiquinone oxidoreductase subunit 4 (subunit M)
VNEITGVFIEEDLIYIFRVWEVWIVGLFWVYPFVSPRPRQQASLKLPVFSSLSRILWTGIFGWV